jgi:hypothetical protein
MSDKATVKFELVDDEDSCCGLMHIAEDQSYYICSGYGETEMSNIVGKLNLHDELVEALQDVKLGLEQKLVGSDAFTLESMIYGVSKVLTKIDSDADGEK